MPPGYEYGNTRLRAMRSRLLREADYHNLLARKSVAEVIAALVATPYKQDIEAALVRTSDIASIYSALRTNLTRTLQQVQTFYEGEPRLLIDLLLRRWDRHNLLTILRGQSQEVAPENLLPVLMPVGQLDEVALAALVRQPGLRAVLDLMRTWRLPYVEAFRTMAAAPELDQLELALNRFHYADLLLALTQGRPVEQTRTVQPEANRALVYESLQTEIDLINIGVVLRLARHPELLPVIQRRYGTADGRPLLIEPGGHLQAHHLAGLVTARGGVETVIQSLERTRYGAALHAGWVRYQAGEGGLPVVQRELERWLAQHAAALFTHDPLGVAIPIAYLECKQVEIANLRLIAQAVALDMPREQVWRDLIIA